jgi:hypothetical protein
MASSRFGSPKSMDEERRIFKDSIPKNTVNNTITQMSTKEDREEITEAEETALWEKGLLGAMQYS